MYMYVYKTTTTSTYKKTCQLNIAKEIMHAHAHIICIDIKTSTVLGVETCLAAGLIEHKRRRQILLHAVTVSVNFFAIKLHMYNDINKIVIHIFKVNKVKLQVNSKVPLQNRLVRPLHPMKCRRVIRYD